METQVDQPIGMNPKFNNFYDAFLFLEDHPAFCHLEDGKPGLVQGFMDNLYVEVAKVDPITGMMSNKDDAVVEVWLEAGPWVLTELCEPASKHSEMRSHDIRLDCGAATYEAAIIKMANLVYKYYGPYDD